MVRQADLENWCCDDAPNCGCPKEVNMPGPTETPPTEMHLCCDDFPDCDCGEEDEEVTEGWNPIDHESETQQKLDQALEEIRHLKALINTPETEDFIEGVKLEAAHQIERWGNDHDRGKTEFDWIFLIGHLATRAAGYYQHGNIKKGKHHCITTAAALLNWHRFMSGEQKEFLPGINPKQYFKED